MTANTVLTPLPYPFYPFAIFSIYVVRAPRSNPNMKGTLNHSFQAGTPTGAKIANLRQLRDALHFSLCGVSSSSIPKLFDKQKRSSP